MDDQPRFQKSFEARRDKARKRLLREGMAPMLAERWLTAWEASTDDSRFDLRSRLFWDRGLRWIQAAVAGGQEPPASLA